MESGYGFFRSDTVNKHLEIALNYWKVFLDSPASTTYLTETPGEGWFSPQAWDALQLDEFQLNKVDRHFGFDSWNAFFCRKFKEGLRPLPENDSPEVAVSPCEATPFKLVENVQLTDQFWLKEQPYSLIDIFTYDREELATHFIGGSVYQAYLKATEYHRWHTPVSGRVEKSFTKKGTYFSKSKDVGENYNAPSESQAYLAAVATRHIIVVDTGEEAFGKVACVFVGMAEVSSCVPTVQIGEYVQKGSELGYFQYGGSSVCIIFEKSRVEEFLVEDESEKKVRLREPLARLRRALV